MRNVSTSVPSSASNAKDNLSIFNGRRGWQVGTLVPAFVLAVFLFWLGSAWYALSLEGKPALNFDFKVFWSAGRIAYQGEPLAVFDIDRLIEIHQAHNEGEWGPWLYPPAFLLGMQPLGALTFSQAWAVFSTVSILSMVLAVRSFSCGILPVWFAFALPPALLPSLYLGQTTALWTAGLLAALAALRDHRYVLAGFFIGLLTLKPQLGLLIPIALIACGAWRTIASAVITTTLISIAGTWVVGVDYWVELQKMLGIQADWIRNSISSNSNMLSPYSLLASLGVGEKHALTLQWMITALSGVAVFLAWRSPKVNFDLRVAVLMLGIVLSSPYLWHYEVALLAMTALFLLRAGILTRQPWGIALAAAMWIGVSPAFLFDAFRESTVFSLRLLFFPILVLASLVCFRALIFSLRKPSELSAHDEVIP